MHMWGLGKSRIGFAISLVPLNKLSFFFFFGCKFLDLKLDGRTHCKRVFKRVVELKDLNVVFDYIHIVRYGPTCGPHNKSISIP